jgi:hypothetical protein
MNAGFLHRIPYLAGNIHTMQNKHINPFINNLVVPYIEYVTKIDIHDETMEQKKFGFEVESQQHFRVYTNKTMREFLFRKLTIYARDLLSAIQHFTHPDYKYVILNQQKVEELYGHTISRRRYEDTVRELIRFAIIDCKDKSKDQYWYNPHYFSPNNRLTLFEECKLKVKTEYVRRDRELQTA